MTNGARATAHLADPGRLRELLLPDRRLWLRPAPSGGRRKTEWTAVLVERPDRNGLVSMDTTLPNRLIGRALTRHALPELDGWSLVRPEVTVGRHRMDFLLADDAGGELLLEIKSVTLVENGEALFPDAVTARGAAHLALLASEARRGRSSALLFVAQRSDARRVRAASEIDPLFAEALDDARAAGVQILARRCRVTLNRLCLGAAIAVA